MLDETFRRIEKTISLEDEVDEKRAICRPAADIDTVVSNDYLLGEQDGVSR